MVDKSQGAAAEGENATPPVPPTPVVAPRRPGHRGMDPRETVAELTAKAHEISQSAGSKVAAAMKEVIGAAAGLTGFAVESARDLIQYMVRRGQMTQIEGDKLLREVEAAHGTRKPPVRADESARSSASRGAPSAAAPSKPAPPSGSRAAAPKPSAEPKQARARETGESKSGKKAAAPAAKTGATETAKTAKKKTAEKATAREKPAAKKAAEKAPAAATKTAARKSVEKGSAKKSAAKGSASRAESPRPKAASKSAPVKKKK